ncbi:site-specific DNA-methyltransferase [Campylobacter ureolyticus]|uniref:site-specific DNA-methyltransferase (adenine-specific) n=4 Tax=Campylobacter ureolyticus TaxID=827 RepID=A0A381EA18_9BACT|nr:site-specific DNA-methyltransferase [Campylobacter ureolyticus]MCR8685651.1 site-specific DNA-methyltransferase [Campylobacter ureolyticus]QKF84227.1 type IIP restriction/modification system, DNA methyltransferase [Campylobacter ureolyticus]QKF84631.1 type IIP restriction/modification system, DNA methyltransferase [Campylobacter ureolyticus]QKF84693.1 type IIP restriction/modification system, DNA methyltransferase [Campylobacter ureolyticus]QKF85011.1 type IIP restriction/modification syste
MSISLNYDIKKTEIEILEKINRCSSDKLNVIYSDQKTKLIYQDNFQAMSILLKTYNNKIDLVYIDPPFNTGQDFFYSNSRTSSISNSETDKLAYSDIFELDDYLEFIRERLFLIHKLLSDKGTLYLHIDIKMGHYIKIILDEIFGKDNFLNEITRIKSNPKNFKRKAYGNIKDTIYVYAKKKCMQIFNDISIKLSDEELLKKFPKIDKNGERYTTVPCHAPGETLNGNTGKKWRGLLPPKGRHWRSSPDELEMLDKTGLIEWSKTNNPRIKKYAKDHKGKKIQDIWGNFKDPQYPKYPTEKNLEMLELIVKQSSNENSIIMDCFCGSGSFLIAGLKNNRNVIGIDISEQSMKISKQNIIK